MISLASGVLEVGGRGVPTILPAVNTGTSTMSAWAYRCHPCVEGEADWFVSQLDVEQLGPNVRIVRVRVGRGWKCALLDRTQAVVVENQLLRDVIASDEADCPECAEMLAAATSAPIAGTTDSARP